MVAGSAHLGRDASRFSDVVAATNQDVYFLLRRSDRSLLYASANAKAFLGVAPILHGDNGHLYELIVEPEQDLVRAEVDRWLSAVDPSPLELDVRLNNPETGADKPCRIAFKPGQADQLALVILREIIETASRIVQLEEQLREKEELFQERIDALNRMAHEIRSPLSGIIGMLRLAESHLDDMAELRVDIKKAMDMGTFLLGLVNDVLDMSRLSSGKVELDIKPFDMVEVARDVRSLFERQALEKGIDYTVRMSDCTDSCLLGDRLRLTQVIINFVSNALKFTPQGGSVSVVFRQVLADGAADAREDGKGASISDEVRYAIDVADTGCGMDAQTASTIFQPFVQGEAGTTKQFGGTGLGMSIADSLARMMGGTIEVDSQLGKGSRFRLNVAFPKSTPELVRQENAAMQRMSRAMTGQDASAITTLNARAEAASSLYESATAPDQLSLSGLHFLVAEDNEVNAQITDALLKMRGASCVRAHNGDEAVMLFSNCLPGTFDAILMDIHMPVCDGRTATGMIRSLDRMDAKETPIIALSAGVYEEEKNASLEAGMDAHLGKPIDFEELAQVLYRAKTDQHGDDRG